MEAVIKKVNRVYSKQNPSQYLTDLRQVDKFVKNRMGLLHELKLPKKIFKNSKLIDYGSGTGLNTLVYGVLGADCTLIEFDKRSYKYSKKIFKKFSSNKFRIINKDIFQHKTKIKYDFVVSNGVAHHTKNPILNLKICVNSLKQGGFFILGIGEKSGFFQRNLQRYILYSLCKNEKEITDYSKFLFKDHLKKAAKYSGRTVQEVIADTYLNPKINTVSLKEILNFFSINNLELYSFYGRMKTLNQFFESRIDQFRHKKTKKNLKKNKFSSMNLNLHDIENFSLSNNYYKKSFKSTYKKINELNKNLDKLTNSINDLEFGKKLKGLHINVINSIEEKIKKINNVELINKNHQSNFLKELKAIFKILNTNMNQHAKASKIKKYLSDCKVLLKGVNGTGMNYIVGYKK